MIFKTAAMSGGTGTNGKGKGSTTLGNFRLEAELFVEKDLSKLIQNNIIMYHAISQMMAKNVSF